MKTKRVENLVWYIFAGLGLLFILIGIFICINTFNYENTINTTGTITNITTHKDIDGDTEHEVYISYNIDGKEYESKLNGYSSSFYEGKQIEIYYDKDNPNKIGVKSIDLVFLIFPILGLISFIIGMSGLMVKIKRKKFEKRLKENGKIIYGDYVETILNTSYRVNGKHPYNIICEWNNPIDNQKYIFKSKNIWINPEHIIEEKNIKQFPIYIDEQNIKKYIIDTDKLTENVVDLR